MTLIQRKDGTMYDLLDAGIRTRDVLISSPTPIHHFEEVEGGNGVIDYGTTYGPREITCYYRAQSSDITDFSLLRDEIFNLFRTEESFYLIEKRERGKRWLVKVANPFAIPQRNVYGDFEVEFIGIKGVSESIGTTQDIHKNGINADDGLWGFGMGLQSVDETLKYIHDTRTFRVYNAGNTAIHPFQQDLLIMLNGIFNEGYELKNRTTGDTFRVVKDMHGTIVLDGAEVANNGLQALRNTNRQFISLAPGWNDFEQSSNNYLVFSFRFYYF